MRHWPHILCVLAALGATLCARTLHAHEFKLEAVINAFVAAEPGGEVHVVVRAPLYLFKAAKFPIRNAEIDVALSQDALERALAAIQKDIALFENDHRLDAVRATGRLSLPSDRSFESYDEALRHLATPVAADTQIYVDQGYVDAHLVFPMHARNAELSIRTTAAPELGDSLKLTVRYLSPDRSSRTLILTSGSGMVALDPTWWHAASGFVTLGVRHIASGVDHLLFLLCLIVPLRGWRQILAIVTTFTIAHSFTLIGSAFGLAPAGAWFPPFVETVVAASIVYMALENILGVEIARRLLVTGMFGLMHGFGFSYGLQENLQFAGKHLLVSLFAFNVGIEIGQLCALALMLPALALVRRWVLPGPIGMTILSSLLALTGWQWMLDRGRVWLGAPWPSPTFSGLAVLAFWIAGILLAAGGLRLVAKRVMPATPKGEAAPMGATAD
jgi:hypothetical protein